MVVRAIGPSLADSGVADPLADPTLDLYDANGAVIRSDDNWRETQESLIRLDRPRARRTTSSPRSSARSGPAITPRLFAAMTAAPGWRWSKSTTSVVGGPRKKGATASSSLRMKLGRSGFDLRGTRPAVSNAWSLGAFLVPKGSTDFNFMHTLTCLRRSSACLLAATALLASASGLFAQEAPVFSQVIVFGDSLSDNGNIRNRLEDQYFISYPGGDFNYQRRSFH